LLVLLFLLCCLLQKAKAVVIIVIGCLLLRLLLDFVLQNVGLWLIEIIKSTTYATTIASTHVI